MANSAFNSNGTAIQVSSIRTITASGAVTMTNTDNIVEIAQTVPAACSVTSPPSPTPGYIFTVIDGAGNAATYPITITPSSGTISGLGSWQITSNYGWVRFYYNGTNLRIVG